MFKKRFSKPVKKQTLAEQVSATIRESILAGEWDGGSQLPIETALSEQFGVSRAVVRDATRLLIAQGLVRAEHGRGVFVTHSQQEAFGRALLLALRRAPATVWDVAQFEQIIYPEVCALAATEATDDEINHIKKLMALYLEAHKRMLTEYKRQKTALSLSQQEAFMTPLRHFIQAIFDATHNQVFILLASPLLKLRTARAWRGTGLTLNESFNVEATYYEMMVEAIASRDPQVARITVATLMELPESAEVAMRETAVGEVPHIT